MAVALALTAAPPPSIVQIPVTITDSLGRSFNGLDAGDIAVYEDNVRQKIVSFGRSDTPLSIGIVLDTSASMGNALERSVLAANGLLKTLNSGDEAFLVEVSDRPQLTVAFTHRQGDIQARLASAQPVGRTALLDAIYLALSTMEKAANPRKALIVISDGLDHGSVYTAAEVGNQVRRADVLIFGIGVRDSSGPRARSPEDLAGPEALRSLSEPTGGRLFTAEASGDMADVAAKIGIELRNEYVVGYTSENQARDGKYRKIQVKLVHPRGAPALHAYWRTGYFAPTQ